MQTALDYASLPAVMFCMRCAGASRQLRCVTAVNALNVTLLLFGMPTVDGGVGCYLTNDTIRLCHAANDAVTARLAIKAVEADVAAGGGSPVSPTDRMTD
jgi:hypothetical protein